MRQEDLKGDNSSRPSSFAMKPWQHVLNPIGCLLLFWIKMDLSHCGATNPQMLVPIKPEPCAQKNS